MATVGININDKKEKWSELLLSGEKTIETRNTNKLKSLVGKPVALIRTGVGKAHIVGFIMLGEPIVYNTLAEFRADEHRHRVRAGSPFDFKEKKYGYPVKVLHKLEEPLPVDSIGIVSRKINPYELR